MVRVVVVGAAAYVALIAMVRVSGERSLSKLIAFDLIVTIAPGSTLASVLLSSAVAPVRRPRRHGVAAGDAVRRVVELDAQPPRQATRRARSRRWCTATGSCPTPCGPSASPRTNCGSRPRGRACRSVLRLHDASPAPRSTQDRGARRICAPCDAASAPHDAMCARIRRIAARLPAQRTRAASSPRSEDGSARAQPVTSATIPRASAGSYAPNSELRETHGQRSGRHRAPVAPGAHARPRAGPRVGRWRTRRHGRRRRRGPRARRRSRSCTRRWIPGRSVRRRGRRSGSAPRARPGGRAWSTSPRGPAASAARSGFARPPATIVACGPRSERSGRRNPGARLSTSSAGSRPAERRNDSVCAGERTAATTGPRPAACGASAPPTIGSEVRGRPLGSALMSNARTSRSSRATSAAAPSRRERPQAVRAIAGEPAASDARGPNATLVLEAGSPESRRSNTARAVGALASAPARAARRAGSLGASTTVPPRAAATAPRLGRGGAERVCAASHTRPPPKATAIRPPVSDSTCAAVSELPGSCGTSAMAARAAVVCRVSKSSTADAPTGMKANGSMPFGARGGATDTSGSPAPRPHTSTSTTPATRARSGSAMVSARLRRVRTRTWVGEPEQHQ